MKNFFKTIYNAIITFLYNNYVGATGFWLNGRTYLSYTKASRLMIPFMVIWGSLKVWEQLVLGAAFFQWWDVIFLLLLIVQLIAGFSEIIKNQYNKIKK